MNHVAVLVCQDRPAGTILAYGVVQHAQASLCALVGVLSVIGMDTLMAFDLSGQLMGDLLVIVSIFMWGIFTVLGKGMTQNI